MPDFRGNESCVRTIVESGLDVFAHNIETVESLTPFVRDRRAQYRFVMKHTQYFVSTVCLNLRVVNECQI